MSFPRYPNYKASGVEWLGDVPEHWTVNPCRAIVHERTAKNEGARCIDYLSLMANVGVIPYAEKGDVGNKKPEDVSKCKMVTRGDFVINSMNYGIGSYGLSAYDGVCSPVYIVLKPQNDVVESRFAFRIFENRAFQTFAQSFGNGILEHRCAINWDILKGIGVGVPPQSEQKAILAFLDRETAKIDGLVGEQRRLMELLKEKRQAVISHAVTQGLNPHAPMKPSGIEWLGDVPAHWEIGRVKTYFLTCSGGTPNTSQQELYYTDEEDGIPWVRTTDLQNDVLQSVEVFITDKALADTACAVLPPGTVMVAMYGGDGTVGKNGLLAIPAAINQAVCGLLPSTTHSPEFVFRFMQFYRPHWMIGAESSRKDPNISQERVRNAPFPKPPRDEQDVIVKFLETQLCAFDTLTAEAQRAIDLLQERRTALISAAVTGQIDVRPYAEKQAA